MKAVLMSIKAEYVNLIRIGYKSVVIRRTRPARNDNFIVFIYIPKSTPCYHDSHEWSGHVVGEFECNAIERYGYADFEMLAKLGCVDVKDLITYAKGAGFLYGWKITNPRFLRNPVELQKYHKPCINELWCESKCQFYNMTRDLCENNYLQFSRPPQSWCYVSEYYEANRGILPSLIRPAESAFLGGN